MTGTGFLVLLLVLVVLAAGAGVVLLLLRRSRGTGTGPEAPGSARSHGASAGPGRSGSADAPEDEAPGIGPVPSKRAFGVWGAVTSAISIVPQVDGQTDTRAIRRVQAREQDTQHRGQE